MVCTYDTHQINTITHKDSIIINSSVIISKYILVQTVFLIEHILCVLGIQPTEPVETDRYLSTFHYNRYIKFIRMTGFWRPVAILVTCEELIF